MRLLNDVVLLRAGHEAEGGEAGGRHLGGLVVGQAELVAARLRGWEGAVLLRDHLNLERAQADGGQVRARGDEVEEGAPLAWLGSGLGSGSGFGLGLGLGG